MAETKSAKLEKLPVCGIVMPISAIDECSEEHWSDIREILNAAISDAGFEANLVSNSDDIGVIQARIIQNLYENEIVVCDVSGKNANVMFELGLRLAFDKPTIVIKDDKTGYSFDTSPLEHLEYPRDLRFQSIVEFKEKLAKKIKATVKSARDDPNYTTFLKHFGTYKIAGLESKEVTEDQYILSELSEIKNELSNMRSPSRRAGIRHDKSDEASIAKFSAMLRKQLEAYSKSKKMKYTEFSSNRDKLSSHFMHQLNAPDYLASSDEYDKVFDAVLGTFTK